MLLIISSVLLHSVRSSLVMDEVSQQSPHVDKYCPASRLCPEGTHVYCTHYDHNYRYGRQCVGQDKLTMTPQITREILRLVNLYRGYAASRNLTDYEGNFYPKAYGMIRLQWDPKLAEFAQVLANTCLRGIHDVCRATDKFPDPSQEVRQAWSEDPGNVWHDMDVPTILKWLQSIVLKMLYQVDNRERQTHVPVLYPPGTALLQSNATHIGCGLTAFNGTSWVMAAEEYKNHAAKILHIVCNFSRRFKPPQVAYDSKHPGSGFTDKCGCPPGYKESESCLCEEDTDIRQISDSTVPAYVIQPDSQTVKQTTTDETKKKYIGETTYEHSEETANKHSEETTNKHSEETTNKHSEETANKYSEETANEHSEETTNKQNNETTQNNSDEDLTYYDYSEYIPSKLSSESQPWRILPAQQKLIKNNVIQTTAASKQKVIHAPTTNSDSKKKLKVNSDVTLHTYNYTHVPTVLQDKEEVRQPYPADQTDYIEEDFSDLTNDMNVTFDNDQWVDGEDILLSKEEIKKPYPSGQSQNFEDNYTDLKSYVEVKSNNTLDNDEALNYKPEKQDSTAQPNNIEDDYSDLKNYMNVKSNVTFDNNEWDQVDHPVLEDVLQVKEEIQKPYHFVQSHNIEDDFNDLKNYMKVKSNITFDDEDWSQNYDTSRDVPQEKEETKKPYPSGQTANIENDFSDLKNYMKVKSNVAFDDDEWAPNQNPSRDIPQQKDQTKKPNLTGQTDDIQNDFSDLKNYMKVKSNVTFDNDQWAQVYDPKPNSKHVLQGKEEIKKTHPTGQSHNIKDDYRDLKKYVKVKSNMTFNKDELAPNVDLPSDIPLDKEIKRPYLSGQTNNIESDEWDQAYDSTSKDDLQRKEKSKKPYPTGQPDNIEYDYKDLKNYMKVKSDVTFDNYEMAPVKHPVLNDILQGNVESKNQYPTSPLDNFEDYYSDLNMKVVVNPIVVYNTLTRHQPQGNKDMRESYKIKQKKSYKKNKINVKFDQRAQGVDPLTTDVQQTKEEIKKTYSTGNIDDDYDDLKNYMNVKSDVRLNNNNWVLDNKDMRRSYQTEQTKNIVNKQSILRFDKEECVQDVDSQFKDVQKNKDLIFILFWKKPYVTGQIDSIENYFSDLKNYMKDKADRRYVNDGWANHYTSLPRNIPQDNIDVSNVYRTEQTKSYKEKSNEGFDNI